MLRKVQNHLNTEERISFFHFNFLRFHKFLFGDKWFKNIVFSISETIEIIEIIEISRSFWSAPTLGALEESFQMTIFVPLAVMDKVENRRTTQAHFHDFITIVFNMGFEEIIMDEIWIAWFRNLNWITSLQNCIRIWIFFW